MGKEGISSEFNYFHVLDVANAAGSDGVECVGKCREL